MKTINHSLFNFFLLFRGAIEMGEEEFDVYHASSQLARLTTGLVGYEEAEDAVKLAIVMKQHLLLIGKPGTAKSMFADIVFQHFENAKIFKIQLSKFTGEEALFGPPNIKVLKEEGRIIYETENTLLSADFAFLDEIFDANDALLRSLLQILNERRFAKGTFYLPSLPLWTVIATSNYQRINNVTEAVIDRFLFKVTVKSTEDFDVDQLMQIILYTAPATEPIPLSTLSTLHKAYLSKITENDTNTINIIASIAKELAWSPRRARWAYHAVKAAELLGWKITAETISRVLQLLTINNDERKIIKEKTEIAVKANEQKELLEQIKLKYSNLPSCTNKTEIQEIIECMKKYNELLKQLRAMQPANEMINKKRSELLDKVEGHVEQSKNRLLELALR